MTRTQHGRECWIDITEDAASGISIRVHHNGRLPDPLAGIDRDILRKARPLVWNGFERRVLRKARSMSRPTYKFIRATLIAERAMRVQGKLRIKQAEPKRRWPSPLRALQRFRLQREQRLRAETKVVDMLPKQRREMTLGERLRERSGTALASPRPQQERERVRTR